MRGTDDDSEEALLDWSAPIDGDGVIVGIDGVPEDMLVSEGRNLPSPRTPSKAEPSPRRISAARTVNPMSPAQSAMDLSGYGSAPVTPSFMVSPGPNMDKASQILVEVQWNNKMRTSSSEWFQGGTAWFQAELKGLMEEHGVSYARVVAVGCAASGFEYVPLSMVRMPLRGGSMPQKVGDEAEGAEEVAGTLVWYRGIVTDMSDDTIELCVSHDHASSHDGQKVLITFARKTCGSRLRCPPMSPSLSREDILALLEKELGRNLGDEAQSWSESDRHKAVREACIQDELAAMRYADDDWVHAWHDQCREGRVSSHWGIKGELKALSDLLCYREAFELSEYAREGASFDRDVAQMCSMTDDGRYCSWSQFKLADADELVDVCMERLECVDVEMRSKASRVLLVAAIGLAGCNQKACRQVRRRLGCADAYYALLQALAASTGHYMPLEGGDFKQGVGEGGPSEGSDGGDGAAAAGGAGADGDYEPQETAWMRRREISAHSNLLFVTMGLLKAELLDKSGHTSTDSDSSGVNEVAKVILSRRDEIQLTLPEVLVDLLSRAGQCKTKYPVPYKKLVCVLHRCLLLALPPPSPTLMLGSEQAPSEKKLRGGKCSTEDVILHSQKLESVYEDKMPVCLKQGHALLQSKVRLWNGMKSEKVAGRQVDMLDIEDTLPPSDTPGDQLYEMLLVRLPTLVVSLLKLLLAAGVNAKESSSPPVDDLLFDVDFEGERLVGSEAAVSWERHRKIVVCHAPACLLLLIKRWRHSHFLQAEYLGRLVSDSNYLLLALKYLNQDCSCLHSSSPGVAELDAIILASIDHRSRRMVDTSSPPAAEKKRDAKGRASKQGKKRSLDFKDDEMHQSLAFSSDEDEDPDEMELPEPPLASPPAWKCNLRCHRHFTCVLSVLRLLLRVVKHAPARLRTLVTLKAPLILRKPVVLPSALIERYSLKLFKSVGHLLGRKWKQSNGKILTRIFHVLPHDFHGDFLEPDSTSDDYAMYHEKRLRIATDEFNYKHYLSDQR